MTAPATGTSGGAPPSTEAATGTVPAGSDAGAAGLPDGLQPAHRVACRELLAWGGPRPAIEPGLAGRLEQRLVTALDEAMGDHDERVWLGKSALRALDCDGRWLDQQETPFEPSTPLVRGKLVHAAIELDTASGRRDAPDAVVDRVMDDMAARPSAEAAHLAGLDNLEVARVRAECRDRVVEWRELWPLLEQVHTRFEQPLRWHHDRGRVTVQGRPDMVVTSRRPRPDVATAIIVDLKTGWRNEVAERADLRLYGLLWTLKHRQPPFRWATYYLAEGRWDVEDATPALLESAVDRLVHAAAGVVRVRTRDHDDELRLHPGSHCRFCGRRPDCPAAPDMP